MTQRPSHDSDMTQWPSHDTKTFTWQWHDTMTFTWHWHHARGLNTQLKISPNVITELKVVISNTTAWHTESASGAKAYTKHLESRLEVIQGHTFWNHWKANEELCITV